MSFAVSALKNSFTSPPTVRKNDDAAEGPVADLASESVFEDVEGKSCGRTNPVVPLAVDVDSAGCAAVSIV